jgi:methylglutaconyl-CoA hydratase
MPDLATLTIDARIARLTLNRADKRNALSLDLLADLHARVDELAAQQDVAACIITGAGSMFCAGMDLKAVLHEPGAPVKLLTSIAELTIKIRRLPLVTIARVNGAAIGGGCGLACVCDLSVTHPDSKMGYPEIDLGVCPAVVAPWLVQSIGAGAARRILLQGGTMSGLRAFEIGMVSHCVPAPELDKTVDEIAVRTTTSGLNALRVTKNLLNELDGASLEAMVRKGATLSAQVVEGAEARGMLAKKLGG